MHLNVDPFTFNPVLIEEMAVEIKRLNPNNATNFKNLPRKILQNNSHICCPTFTVNTKYLYWKLYFPDELKCGEVS